jgi:hypothetical protein
VRLSPSQIEAFDPKRGPWGCNRRWWLEKIARIPRTQDASQATGEEMHKRIEQYMETGVNVLGKYEMPAKSFLDDIKPRVLGIERALSYDFGEHTMIGRIDVLLRDGIHDHKTASSFKYAKSDVELKKSTQMAIYADYAWLTVPEWQGLDEVTISLGYLVQDPGLYGRPRAPAFHPVDAKLSRSACDNIIEGVKKTVIEMQQVAEAKNSSEVEPNWNACDVGRGCPHRLHCPRSGDAMSILADLLSPSKPPAQPVITPPDQPKSDPAKAADPVPDFVQHPEAPVSPAAAAMPPPPPVEAPKPRRGRPPKAKSTEAPTVGAMHSGEVYASEQKTFELPAMTVIIADTESKENSLPPPLKVKTVTVRHFSRIGLPNYSSHEMGLEMTAELTEGTSPDTAVDILSTAIKARLELEIKDIRDGIERAKATATK